MIITQQQFDVEFVKKAHEMIRLPAVNRGPAHAMKSDESALTHEMLFVTDTILVEGNIEAWQDMVQPNLPWAEDHFRERVAGEPLNPAPSEAWWPYAREGNAEHKDPNHKFSHTYPERFWPKWANRGHLFGVEYEQHRGIRFRYGDLADLVSILRKNQNSRQAHLPIWFPEDLAAADQGERVPCSLGYHFISDGRGYLNCVYTLRSCDLVRFYRDDVYMAGRLLQYVAHLTDMVPHQLVIHIDNLHCFPSDVPMLKALIAKGSTDRRNAYNFGAMG